MANLSAEQQYDPWMMMSCKAQCTRENTRTSTSPLLPTLALRQLQMTLRPKTLPPTLPILTIPDPDYGDAEITPKMGDNYLTAEIMLPRDGTMVTGRVSARKCDRDGNPVRLANSNPHLNTRSYIVDFDDGNQTELTANLIVESLFSQCDPDGNQYVLLDEIVDHRRLPMVI